MRKYIGTEHRSYYITFDDEDKANWWYQLTKDVLEDEGFHLLTTEDADDDFVDAEGEPIVFDPNGVVKIGDNQWDVVIEAEREIFDSETTE